MFYSETLLSKTGPLAQVWLSANLEKKLTKNQVLSSDVKSSVHAIVDSGQTPLALRLSGQLLLGVVRIYSRKTRYLLDDCNEAILKIKMAFKPGNVDLPANQTNTAHPASLTLPDVLTELDLLGPGPDPSLLLPQPWETGLNELDTTLNGSQYLTSTLERPQARSAQAPRLEDDIGIELDFGDEFLTPSRRGREIEVGRDAPPSRPAADEFDDTRFGEDNFELDLDFGKSPGFGDSSMRLGLGGAPDGDIIMGDMDDDMGFVIPAEDMQERDLLVSPMQGRDLDGSLYRQRDSGIFEPDEVSVHQPQRAKKRRILPADPDTQLHSNQIRAQQNDRSKILKPASFLPRDPMLLALMNMQKSGEFVSNILGDGRSKGWAPELRGVLSLEVVRQSNDLKRKRDSGVAGVERSESARAQLEIDHEDDADPGFNTTIGEDGELINIPADDGMDVPDDELGFDPLPGDDFDHTTIPILPPDESGPVSLNTKHAVHLLREKFGPAAADSPNKRLKSSVLFEELCPAKTTSKAEATKMFFEVLVLATKDAIKVEQSEGTLGGPLRVRGKRGLWGAWAEMQAGGEIEQGEE